VRGATFSNLYAACEAARNFGGSMTNTLSAGGINLLSAIVEQFSSFDDMELRLAGGLKCPRCAASVCCDPEPLGNYAFRLLCRECHGDIITYDRVP